MGFKKPRNYSLFSAKVRANGPKLSPTCRGQAQPPPTTGPAAGGQAQPPPTTGPAAGGQAQPPPTTGPAAGVRSSLRSKNNDATKQGLMAQ